ncbi:MAG: enoyl-CoA hydratase/isomerase family protein [Alcaligenaceae bacterium]
MKYINYAVIDQIAEISLNHAPVNALSIPMLVEIVSAFKAARDDVQVRAVILTSALPKRFCAGLDLDILLDQSGKSVREFLDKLYVELADVQHTLGKPSIAAIDGAARAGGMTLSISCNVIIASRTATFGYPEIDVGMIPAIHFIHLPSIVGRHRAFEILFSGRVFDAQEAVELGLVSQMVEDGTALQAARVMAKMFASKSPNVMRMGHAAFMRINDDHYRRDIGGIVDAFCAVAASGDAKEGISAFIEKRPPKWST